MAMAVSVGELAASLETDLRSLSHTHEARKRFPAVKEAAERAIVCLRDIATSSTTSTSTSTTHSHSTTSLAATSISTSSNVAVSDVLKPFILGCASKSPELVRLAVAALLKLCVNGAMVDGGGVATVLGTLWDLIQSHTQELKSLQIITAMITSTPFLHTDTLARCFFLAFHLYTSKDAMISNTAAATLGQLVTLVFDRISREDVAADNSAARIPPDSVSAPDIRGGIQVPSTLSPSGVDAYLLFLDLVNMTNGDEPVWLDPVLFLPRHFGLELIDTALNTHSDVFLMHPEFSLMLKDRLCPLVIRLFSPGMHKIRQIERDSIGSGGNASTSNFEPRHSFPINARLLRIVRVLIEKFYNHLIMECEIFLSMLVRFLDPDKPLWQRTLAVEVFKELCSQPKLVFDFCQHYDMKPHRTKIFRDMVNALGGFVQSLFTTADPSAAGSSNTSATTTYSTTSSLTAAASAATAVLVGSDAAVSLVPQLPPPFHQSKYLSSLDKSDAPVISESYALSVAFGCLLDIVTACSILPAATLHHGEAYWCGISNDNIDDVPGVELDPAGLEKGDSSATVKITDNDLNADISKEDVCAHPDSETWREMVNSSWCGVLAALSLLLRTSRDEVVTQCVLRCYQKFIRICGLLGLVLPRKALVNSLCQFALPLHYGVVDSPPTMTFKNIQSMHALMNMVHCLGHLLGDSWKLVLETFQALDHVVTVNQISATRRQTSLTDIKDISSIAVAPASDMSVLAATMAAVFVASSQLDESSFEHMARALVHLSEDGIFSRANDEGRAPRLFALGKLGVVVSENASRMALLRQISLKHLVEAATVHPSPSVREVAQDVLGVLVLAENSDSSRITMLSPLLDMSRSVHVDTRTAALATLHRVLESSGGELETIDSWMVIFEVLDIVLAGQLTPGLIKTGFESAALIVNDFLTLLPLSALPACVKTIGAFCSQEAELNVSLTAVGLLWSTADFWGKVCRDAENSDCKTEKGDTCIYILGMSLFRQLAALCVVQRPEVRKSASQTLFSALVTHGSGLGPVAWQECLWDVLFSLISRIRNEYTSPMVESTCTDDGKTGLLSHHSRNTVAKQWDETCVLVLQGISAVTVVYRSLWWAHEAALEGTIGRDSGIKDRKFNDLWTFLLDFIRVSAISSAKEVRMAAITALGDLIKPIPIDSTSVLPSTSTAVHIRTESWNTLSVIGSLASCMDSDDYMRDGMAVATFLTALIHIFDDIYIGLELRNNFSLPEAEKFLIISRRCLLMHAPGSSHNSNGLSPLQVATFHSLGNLQPVDNSVWPAIMRELFYCVSVIADPPPGHRPATAVAINAMTIAMQLFSEHVGTRAFIDGGIYEDACTALAFPMQRRTTGSTGNFTCSPPLWHRCIEWFIELTRKAMLALVNVEKEYGCDNKEIERNITRAWEAMVIVVDMFLFNCNDFDDIDDLESKRVRIIEAIKIDVLPLARHLPSFLVSGLISVLKRGATGSKVGDGRIQDVQTQDTVTRACFDALLGFSFQDDESGGSSEGALKNGNNVGDGNRSDCPNYNDVNRIAVEGLLDRCTTVLAKYVSDEQLSGRCPLPRWRIDEVVSIMSAISTSLNVRKDGAAALAVRLYPHLVECVTCSDTDVKDALKKVLLLTGELLVDPTTAPSHQQIVV